MFVYFDQNGTLKEIVTEKTFRVGDSKRDKIYVYWEGEHSPISGWVKYRKPDGKDFPISIEECFYQIGLDQLVGKALPNKPLRNLKYFSYEHTYEENGETHIGYKFYEITVPDEVLSSANEDDEIPTENNMVIARIRFVMDNGEIEGEIDEADTIETLGAVVFAVETNIGILTDSSINETQYNYLIKLIGTKLSLNIKSLKVDVLPEYGEAETIYYVRKNDGIIYDAYFWNGSYYVFLGTTSYGIYTEQEGQDFEIAIQALWNAELNDYKNLMNRSWQEYQSIVNSQVNTLETEVHNIVSGTPRGTYATLTALQNAFPTGAQGVYIVTSNGHWYYWNGSAWTDGGVYLSTGDAVPASRTIIGIDLQDDITKPEFVEALCDGSLSSTSNNPVKNKVISKVLDVDQHYYSVGTVKNDNAPGGISDIFSTWGMTFNKADLNEKDINKVITRLCCYKSGTTFPRTIRLKIYNTPFESATNLGTSTTLSDPIYYKDFIMTESPQNFEIDVAVAYDDLSTVFAVVFQDRSLNANNTSGLYISRANTDDILANKNGSVSAYYTDGTNYLRFGGNSYYGSGYGNCYLSFGYVTLDIVKQNDLSGYVSKEEIGLEKQENPNIWNKNEEVLGSWASPANGVIQVYPDNPYISNYARSGYIPVKKNTEYIFSIFNNVNYGGHIYICYYNSNKVFISSVSMTSLPQLNGQTFTTPNNDNIAYAIISFNQKGCLPAQLEEGYEASPYHEYTGDKYLADNLLITTDQIIDANTPESYINLPDELYAVVGDKFEMFYKGILNVKSYENMYVQCICDIGKSYQRKFELTPITTNIGNHTLQVQVYDNNKVMIDSKNITLKVVAKATSPANNKNILCMGDSLTEGGTWVAELHRRINLTSSSAVYGGDAPQGLGLTNITFVGKRQTANGAGFEGFGGWRFSTYLNPATSTDDYWIACNGHDKTNDDQESVWQASNGTQWQLETIETNRIKVKKYSGSGALPANGTLTWVSGGVHTGNITYTSSSLAEGNPFAYNGEIDFEAYCEDLGITTIDEVYILLGWNDVGTALSTYKAQAKQFIDLLRAFNPSIKVVLMGLEVPAADGMANNYGADSLYNYYKGQKFVFDLNNLYQEIASEYPSGVSFANVCSQFDTEYCMQTMETTPNSRVATTIEVQSNGVHPAISGYYEIADVIYRWICAKIN